MTALSKDKRLEYTEGVELSIPVDDADKIYGGAFVCVNAAGYAVEGSDTSGLLFMGVAMEQVDNTLGLDGAKNINIRRRGLVKAILGTAISQANVGDNVYLVDDQTVDLVGNTTNDIYCGIIAAYIDSTHAWIDIEPAVRQSDSVAHIADGAGAHAASAISVADAGTFTTQTEVEAALQEIYQHILTAQGFIPISLMALREASSMAVGAIAANGGVLASDTTPILQPINGATDGCQQVVWAASNNDQVIFQIPLPPDLDDTADLILHIRIKSAGTTNAVGFTVASWFDESDTAVSDTSETNQTAGWLEKIATIAAADVPAGPQTLTVGLTPAAHTTDIMYLSAVWLEYKRKLLTT